MNTDPLKTELDELKAKIPYRQSQINTAAILLFKDYLCKINMWYKRLGIQEDFHRSIYRTDQGHNLVYLIAPELLKDNVSQEEFKSTYLKDFNIDQTYKSIDATIIYTFILWNKYKNYPQFDNYKDLPNPYESSIKILLRGNHTRRGEMVTIEVDNLPVKKQFDFTLPSLEDNFLDFIDTKCKRSGSYGIPNRERINQLWKEFNNII